MPNPERPLKVFLCHSSQDKPIIQELHNRLISEGWIDPWLDKEKLRLGDDFDWEIETAIESSDAVVAFISENAVKKTGYIQKELRLVYDAQMYRPDGDLFTIPIRLENCEPPRRFRYWHWGNYFGEEKEKTYQSLLKSLRLIHERVLKNESLEQARKISAKEITGRESAENMEQEGNVEGAREKQVRGKKEKGRKQAAVQPRIKKQSIYWFGGFIVFVLGILLISLLNNSPLSIASTPEGSLPLVESISTFTETVEPSPTATLTPESTYTPTPLPTEITDAKGATMVFVPEGGFAMGSSDYFSNEAPVHFVLLSSYYIDKYEVTIINYSQCVNDGVCLPPTKRGSYSYSDYFGNLTFSRYPVIYITWQMANEYCEWRGSRLPTEAEWEKAARGNSGRNYPWGDSVEGTYANYNGIEGDVKPIGSFLSGISPYGVMDLSGNVQEWVSDWYQADYYSSLPSNVRNPMGPSSGNEKVLRGGSWDADKNFIRTTYRSKDNPSTSFYNIGFRCARATDSTPQEVTPSPTLTPEIIGFELISISEIAYRGGTAKAEIKTQPRTACELGYILPSGDLSGAAGTGPDTADENGICSWEWTIAHATNPGWGNIYIKAGGMDESYPVEIR